MEIVILPGGSEIGRMAADVIESLLERKPDAVLGLATGSSPLPIYQELIRRHRSGILSFAQAEAFTLDEYIGLPDQHPELYREVIRREFTRHVDFAEDRIHGPDGLRVDLPEACNNLPATVASCTGARHASILGSITPGSGGLHMPAVPTTPPRTLRIERGAGEIPLAD